MNIYITYGIGEGLTKLAAFDAALFDAGIANYNLIRLTSVIPPHSRVIVKKLNWNSIEYGHKLYVVLSAGEEYQIGKSIYAGLGWRNFGKAGGIFVEHQAENKNKVMEVIRNSLYSVEKYRRTGGKIRQKIVGVKCKNNFVCVLVAAVYKSENWDSSLK